MTARNLKIAIVGAGLTGLVSAVLAAGKGRRVSLYEARNRVGGRILSLPGSASDDLRYDLGPAWIWPHNKRMLRLVSELGLPLMRQHSVGNLVFQDVNGHVRRDLEFATMGDALRVPGGFARLTEKLAAQLPEDAIHLGHSVNRIEALPDSLRLAGTNAAGSFSLKADRVVLALPPRLAARRLTFSPAFPPDTVSFLSSVPTWMAGHAKIVAIYEKAFWREAGLSGDAISHRGPLFEMHDASAGETPDGEAALFGFVSPGRCGSDINEQRLLLDAISQLADLFGPQAAEPVRVHLVNWASEPETATPLDTADLAGHPRYREIGLASDPWAGRLLFSGTETAPENGGFLEGALEAAEKVAGVLA